MMIAVTVMIIPTNKVYHNLCRKNVNVWMTLNIFKVKKRTIGFDYILRRKYVMYFYEDIIGTSQINLLQDIHSHSCLFCNNTENDNGSDDDYRNK